MIYIGTSGYFYGNWVGGFYPPDLPKSKFFEYYVNYFNTLELNSTFYRFPKESTIKSWRSKLKKLPDFKLSIKANKSITHYDKLKPTQNLNMFLQTIKPLDGMIGALLFQLPPSLNKDEGLLGEFCNKLDKNINYAIEFRNRSWYAESVYEILKKHNVALVWHDYNQELITVKTAEFEYVRLHGYGGKYKGSYPKNILKNLAAKLENSYVYFNNTADLSAIKDALMLKSLIEEKH
ncbi:MAG: DUF72 domain-containing protein [Epsilonproteobacteria bacterium]|nr:DUF72 domain-containing protein [Campylobacterota bacterium]